MKIKKYLLTVLSILLVFSLMFGCTKNPKGGMEQQKSESPSPTVQNDEKKASDSGKASEKPIELSIHMHYWNRIVFNNDWPVFKKAAELTNVSLKGTASSAATDSVQVFNIMLTSNEIPDIVHTMKENFVKYAQDGVFIPLDDLIDKHAPNLKAFLEKNPEVAKFSKGPDGKTYFIPFIPDGDVAKGWFIRKDWLDKLNLAVPKTADEFYNVLKQFADKDPNNNQKKDEAPYFNRESTNGVNDLLPLFGITRLDQAKDGKYIFWLNTEQYKLAISELAKWYKEGLIDPEIYTRGSKARDIVFEQNIGGSTHDWFASTAGYQDKYKDKIAGLNWVVMEPPADITGKQWEESSREKVKDQGWGITLRNKYPIETIKYFDFWFTEQGRMLANFGIEGDTFNIVNGKPVFTEKILKNEKPPLEVLNSIGAQLEIGVKQDFRYEAQIMNPSALEGVKLYMEKKFPIQPFPKISYTQEEHDIIKTKGTDVFTFINEQTQKWILGAEPINDAAFEKYVKTLESMGVNELIKAKQQAYDRYANMK